VSKDQSVLSISHSTWQRLMKVRAIVLYTNGLLLLLLQIWAECTKPQ